jgi:hypothetical protein
MMFPSIVPYVAMFDSVFPIQTSIWSGDFPGSFSKVETRATQHWELFEPVLAVSHEVPWNGGDTYLDPSGNLT